MIELISHITLCRLFSSFQLPGCENFANIGDGYCDDETNIGACCYDGGDCCRSCVSTEYCSNCDCLGGLTNVNMTNPLVGNGYCNEGTNTIHCNYDGGDCCSNPDMVDNGICNDENNNIECEYDGGDCCPNPDMVDNGICNDETNNIGCEYDGGDCCGPDVSCK